MARDARGRLWLGRIAGGVAILDGDSVRVLGPSEGATDQTIWDLQTDSEGRMWAATNGDGALRFDDSGVRRFTTHDGLPSNECNFGASMVDSRTVLDAPGQL